MSEEDSLNRLIRFRIAIERVLDSLKKQPKAPTEKLDGIGFTEREKTGWTRNEPDFNIPPRRSHRDNAIE